MEFPLGYREVVPDQTLPEKWKEITLNTGGSQSTLQDIKVPERAGGYSYKDCTNHVTRNRFIYWRICNDVLELVEHSLDVNLNNCRVRYKFMDTPILDGISIHETANSVIILVATVFSVHKLNFSHPNILHKQGHSLDYHPDLSVQSIFSEASAQNAKDPDTFHVIPPAGTTNSPVPHAAASWLTLPQEEALFALAYNSGTILVIRFDTKTGLIHTTELKQDSMVPRFLSGIATAFSRNTEGNVAMGLTIHTCGKETYLFALCREGNVRMWSCSKGQCVAFTDVIVDNREAAQGAQGHVLRKSIGMHDNELYLGTYMKFGSKSEFSVLKPICDAGIFKFVKMCTLFASDQHLVDFSFTTTRLWAMWRTTDMDGVAVTHAQLMLLDNMIESREWETAVLEQPPDQDYIVSDPGTDPRQAYINYIFNPGQFSLSDITRALSIYQRSNLMADMTLSPSVLKERVCAAIEAEIQVELMDYELTDEEYLEITNRCWSKFYSCVIQYHANGSKPVGLLLLENVYGVALLKKSSFSLLRPMEALEHLMLANEKSQVSLFKTTPVLAKDKQTCQDVIHLMSVLVLLEEQLPEDLKSIIERELYQLKSPDTVIEDLLSKTIPEADDPLSDGDFQGTLCHKLKQIKNISNAIEMLLEALRYDRGQPDSMDITSEREASELMMTNDNHLFGSQLGISAISQSVAQIAVLRFSICRNLLILQQIISMRKNDFSTSVKDARSPWAAKTVMLTQAYYVLMWICESNASYASTQTLLENSSMRLAALKLSESRATFGQRNQRSLSLLELFVQNGGSTHVHELMAHTNLDSSSLVQWHHGMLSSITLVAQLIWPISNNFIFPEWLLSSCQFLLVQEYVRLLSTWCEWNMASRKFILAVSLLEMGEPQKATDYFFKAANGVLTDSFIMNIALDPGAISVQAALIRYYLKAIELLEQHNARDCVIKLAEKAISDADTNDSNLPTLHSIIFTQHLNLGHHIDAYHCLNRNPDSERKIDCLRQLVVTLFERKKYNDLVSFPYGEMFEDLVRIVESRARSVDIMDNKYYNFLYSFHVDKGNWRKAASVMYEQSMRFGQESHSVPIIMKQSQYLLVCINALCLVQSKYQWIVRPTMEENFADERDPKMKRSFDGKEILQYKVKKEIDVLELEEIRKEYAIVQAKLKLAKRTSEIHTIAQADPSELIAMLSNVGLYVDALKLCDRFNVCKSYPLENLAAQCARLSYQEDPHAWDWLTLNDISEISVMASSIAVIAWRLLEKLTLEHEKDQHSELHKAVAGKLFQHGAFLPQSLLISYKKRNAAELLRLLLNTGRIAEASDLAVEYIYAVLGNGMENFNLQSSLVVSAPPVWLPINVLERLLLELEHASKDDSSYVELYEQLKNALEYYLKVAERVSEDMVKYKMGSRSAR